MVEKIITLAKTKDVRNAIRAINEVVKHENACRKVMEVLKDRYKTRTSGYTRMVPLGMRQGDGARMVTLELVDAVTGPTQVAENAKPKKAKTSSTSK
jgi:large subunit ribosomal protein L17